ncbi:Hypothetical predicted protein [Cloeon dipterum]|uniref:Chitin-binding type-2 domain-containing protein n=1 Tax=Cloeon dipterum TaxID=197152 RepID=A0A8S1E5D2_9INSE|nr:Hypothetical predicted protein [Cloeon dipterum]
MDHMSIWRYFLLASCMLLPLCLGQVSKEDCKPFTVPPSACDSASSYVACLYNNQTGVLELEDPDSPESINCSPGTICYREGKETNADTPCGPPPPTCTAEGYFAFRDRGCATYYVCYNDGSAAKNLKQAIGTCSQGFEFSETTKKCETVSVAGCSVPAPPPPPPPPSPNPKPTTSAPVIPVTPAKDCPITGERYPDASCRHFLRCDINNKVIRYQCPWRLKYDETKKLCLRKVNCGARRLIM